MLRDLPADLDPTRDFQRITDRYISGTRLRLRHMADEAGRTKALKLTQKYSVPDEPTQTIITNFYLSEAEYATLLPLEAKMLIKRRYRYAQADNFFSIDVFERHLVGLTLAEIEAASDEALAQIRVPDFACGEVTAEQALTGGALVDTTAESLRAQLDALFARFAR